MTASADGTGILQGQTVVVIGGTSGIGLETARLARREDADLIIAARDAEGLRRVGLELGASIAALNITDLDRVAQCIQRLPAFDHLLVTGPGPYYAPLNELDFDEQRRSYDAHLLALVQIARNVPGKVRPGGSLLFLSGTQGRRPSSGALITAHTAAVPALAKNLALELAPVRVNVIAPGFVDTPLSASLLGDGLEERRAELRRTLPIRRVVQASDVAALAIHLMANTAITGATVDIDGGQQLIG